MQEAKDPRILPPPTEETSFSTEETSDGRLRCRVVSRLDWWSEHAWSEGLQIDRMENLESLCIRTENSTYEITVLSKETGKILVRGGRFFPEWTRAHLSGSSLGGSFLKLLGIYLGFNMEFHHGRQRIVTSRVRSIEFVSNPVPSRIV